MVTIAIDGACRRNGKPDCISAGGIFVYDVQDPSAAYTDAIVETISTNQRGELNALIIALQNVAFHRYQNVRIITDSEYLFNAMKNEWPNKWAANNWTLSSGEPVKNMDLWKMVHSLAWSTYEADIAYYHIKGHVIPFGAVTARKALTADDSGAKLYKAATDKFDAARTTKADSIKHAQDLSERNNGFKFEDETLKSFVAMNVVVDAVATKAVDEADFMKFEERYRFRPKQS